MVRLTKHEHIKVGVGIALIVALVGGPVVFTLTGGWFAMTSSIVSQLTNGSIDLGHIISNARDDDSSDDHAYEHTTVDKAVSTEDSFPAEGVRDISIAWHGGTVVFVPSERDAYRVRTQVEPGTYQMDPTNATIELKGTTLTIDDHLPDSDNGFSYPDMQLTVELPASDLQQLRNVELASTVARIDLDGITSTDLSLATVSSDVTIANTVLKDLSISSVSSPVSFTGRVTGTASVATVSGGQALVLTAGLPKTLSAESVSGSIELVAPENAGFTVTFDTISGAFTNDRSSIPMLDEANSYVYGDGAAEVSVSTMSGSLRVS